MQRLRGLMAFYGPPLAFTAAVYGLVQGACALWLDASLRPATLPLDLGLHLVLTVLLLQVTRSRRAFAGLMGLFMVLLHVSNGLKIAVLGGPVMPDDALAVRSLFLIMEDWQFVLACGFLAVLAAAAARALSLWSRRAAVVLTGVAVAAGGVVAAPATVTAALDKTFGNVVWDQRGNYRDRGPLLHLVQESARYAARATQAPARGDVLAAVDLLRPPLQEATLTADPIAAAARVRKPRNVHMVVMETFWDPTPLTAAGYSRDPFDERFRALWQAAGESRALVPVFGGYTANSEFEALCGFPVAEDAVFFEAGLRNAAPCLPRLFHDAGYATVASHPNSAVFWNRVNAYDRAGFEVYWSKNHFDLDDMNGDYLGDASLYRQVLDKLAPLQETGTPTFNYILTFFGHLDFPLNAARPRVVAVDGDERLERYANTVYYKSREFMDFLEVLQARDPDAVVVLFGDHLPFLGGNFESYVRSGVLGSDRGSFDAGMLHTMVSTPLIVIDGANGPLDLGELPLYQLPAVVRRLAGLDEAAPMDLTTTGSAAVRPLPGLTLVVDDGVPAACRGTGADAAACDPALSWLGAVQTVQADVFSGRQHALHDGRLPDDEAEPEFDGDVVLAPDTSPGT